MKSSESINVQSRIKKKASDYGNKAANLIELDNLCKQIKSKTINIQVPDIFPIKDSNIKEHLDIHASEWRTLWEEFVKVQAKNKVLTDEAKTLLKQLQTTILACFNQYPFAEQVTDLKLSADTQLMVRSSGEEDSVEIANPGGNKSVAAVKLDRLAISNAIGVVVASYLSEKSLTQRLLSGDDITKNVFMPVLLQKMIGEKVNGADDLNQIVASGVMYAKTQGITRLDIAPGHGEIIVNSKALFDTYEVTQNNMVHAAIHHKTARLVPAEIKDEKGFFSRQLIFKDNPKKTQTTPTISSETAAEIARIGRKIAEHYGRDMDIELVYEPRNQVLSIVQARPIPESVSHKITPSAIAPDKWKIIKKDAAIQKIKSPVISPAGYEAKIMSADKVILADNIASALRSYLKKPEHREDIHTVVVKEAAPTTSHEAAQFNVSGVSVYQGPIELIENWLEEKEAIVIADVQHQHWIKGEKKALADDKLIVEGMFSSSLSTQKTLLPITKIPNKTIGRYIKKYLENNVDYKKTVETSKGKIYSTLIDCLEIIEAVKIHHANEEAFTALQTMADIFKAIGTSATAKDNNKPHKQLFVHALLSIAEIDHCLSEFSALPDESPFKKAKQQELLDLVSKLKALIINPGEVDLYSDSIHQIAAYNKELAESKIKDVKLTDAQQVYFNEFLKLKTLALNEKTAEYWAQFSLYCAKEPLTQQLLSQMLSFSIKNNVSSEFINNYFIHSFKDAQTKKETEKLVLAELYETMDQSKQEFARFHLNENNQKISAWEHRINEWSKPEKFEKLYKDFNLELVPLITSLTLDEKASNLTQEIILKQVQHLTEVIDKTIKAMKGSIEYKGQENLLLERFIKLLTPYHQLMNKWMQAIPEEFYDKCAAAMDDEKDYNGKKAMIDLIEKVFNEKKEKKSADQLTESGYLSIPSVKVGSTASFKRQFVSKRSHITLEDLFSLFHQNILASTTILNKKSMMSFEDLPKKLQPFLTEISENKEMDLLSIIHHYPVVELEFNIPLDHHSAKLILAFNTKTNTLILHSKFFGQNWNDRMNVIGKIAEIEGLLVGDILQQPYYNNDSHVLEFSWQLNGDKMEYLARKINAIFENYALLTEGLVSQIGLEDMWERHCIDKVLLKNLSPERSLLIGEKLQAANNKILFQAFIKNPEEIRPFLSKIDTALLFENRSFLTFEILEKVINEDHVELELTRKFKENSVEKTFLEGLISEFSEQDAIQFIEKYNPDLHSHHRLLSDVVSNHENASKLVSLLLAKGVSFNLEDLLYTIDDYPQLQLEATKVLEKMDSHELTHLIYEFCHHKNYFDDKARRFIFLLLDQFSDKINLNYKSVLGALTLFESLIKSIDFFTSEKQFEIFLYKNTIDFSLQTQAMDLSLKKSTSFGLVLLKKHIAEHKLDVNCLVQFEPNVMVKLFGLWSAEELKSWIDKNQDKLSAVYKETLMRLYFAKLIKTLTASRHMDERLSLQTVLNCFNDSQLKPKLMAILAEWNSEGISAWLLEALSVTSEAYPHLLEFIQSLPVAINFNKKGEGRGRLFEKLVPFLNDKMSKEAIEIFLEESKVDVPAHPNALNVALESNSLVLAKIFIDKGLKLKDIDGMIFLKASNNKQVQDIIIDELRKLPSAEVTQFLYKHSHSCDTLFYTQLIECFMDYINFAYCEGYSSYVLSLFEKSIQIVDEELLIKIVNAHFNSNTSKSLAIAISQDKPNLAWVILQQKTNSSSLTGYDLSIAMNVNGFSSDKLLTLFKDWKSKDLQSWLTRHGQEVSSVLRDKIDAFYFPQSYEAKKNADGIIHDDLESLIKRFFANFNLADRAQSIKVMKVGIGTIIEFTDSDAPLTEEQVNTVKVFFKGLGVEDKRVNVLAPWQSQDMNWIKHNAQIYLNLETKELHALLLEYLAKQVKTVPKDPSIPSKFSFLNFFNHSHKRKIDKEPIMKYKYFKNI